VAASVVAALGDGAAASERKQQQAKQDKMARLRKLQQTNG